MKYGVLKKKYHQILVIGAGAISLVIAPYISYEVITPPKFLLLGVLAGLSTSHVLVTLKMRQLKTKPLVVTLIFISTLFATLIFNHAKFLSQIYGVDGRRNGVVTYLCLAIIFLSATVAVESTSLKFYNLIIKITSFIASIYAIVQILNLDPIPWDRDINWISSTFGNPNMLSSFLAMSCVPLILSIMAGKIKYNTILLLISLFVVYETRSYQGFVALFLALISIFLVLILKLKKKFAIKGISVALAFVFLVGLILDITQMAPWHSFFYKASLSTRLDYWRAALGIFKNYPIFGVGMDQFGNFYGRFRDLDASRNLEGALATDSVHNIFLDLLVNGGVLLFIAYLIMVSLTFLKIYKTISNFNKINLEYLSLVGIWLVYLLQSLISINNLGLAVWGWIAMGILISFDEEKIGTNFLFKPQNSPATPSFTGPKSNTLLFRLFAGAVTGALVVSPIIKINLDLCSAYSQKNEAKLITAGYEWPEDPRRMSKIAQTLIEIGSWAEAQKMLEKASRLEQDSDVPYKIMLNLPNLTSSERDDILKQILKLDPYFLEVPSLD